tara:strand:- start:1894 stop:2625 length:732 start_codon:yes stop_codon:yes gene_type:complete
MINKIILSPPFSNIYPQISGTTKITGTYTLEKRRGLWRVLTTLRKTDSGWINNVGLRNPGIKKFNKKNSIISIALKNSSEWPEVFDILLSKKEEYNILGIEFNISCPNSFTSNINNKLIDEAKKEFKNISIKMPHITNKNELEKVCNTNSNFIHISNSRPHPKGAASGTSLIKENIKNIEFVRNNFKNINIIAGGGIYNYNQYLDYLNAGASHFSLSTLLINPMKTYNFIKTANKKNLIQEIK